MAAIRGGESRVQLINGKLCADSAETTTGSLEKKGEIEGVGGRTAPLLEQSRQRDGLDPLCRPFNHRITEMKVETRKGKGIPRGMLPPSGEI